MRTLFRASLHMSVPVTQQLVDFLSERFEREWLGDQLYVACRAIFSGRINLAAAPVRTPTTSVGSAVPFPDHNVARVLAV